MINSIITLILILAIVFMFVLMIKHKLKKIIAISLSCLIIAGITVLTLYPIQKNDEPNLEEAQVKLNAFESEKFIDAISLDVLTSIGEYKVVGPKNAYYIKTIKYSDFYINDIVFVDVHFPYKVWYAPINTLVSFKAQRYITYYNKSYYVKELEEYGLTNINLQLDLVNLESKNYDDEDYDYMSDYGYFFSKERIRLLSNTNVIKKENSTNHIDDLYLQMAAFGKPIRSLNVDFVKYRDDYSAEKYKISNGEQYFITIMVGALDHSNTQKSQLKVTLRLDIIKSDEIIQLYDNTHIYDGLFEASEFYLK